MIMAITIVLTNYTKDFVGYIKLMETKENLWFIENLVK